MPHSNTILVVIDPTAREQPALERAGWLAGKLGKDLELFICDYDQYLAGERFFDTKALERARKDLLERHIKRLEKLAEPYRKSGINVSVDASWDHPLHEGIVRKIESVSPFMVVKDTHYHAAIRRSVFSNTDWHLIRDCPTLLWLVKPDTDPDVSTFMAAVDPLHDRDKPARLDHRILEIADQLREAVNGEVHIVHAFDPAPAYAVSTDAMSFPITSAVGDVISELRSQHQAALKDLASAHSVAAERVHLVDGATREALVGAVEELGADVTVIGAVSRSAIQRIVLGNTAERVLDFLPCDLLIVRPEPARAAD
jgi:universal stress protein E